SRPRRGRSRAWVDDAPPGPHPAGRPRGGHGHRPVAAPRRRGRRPGPGAGALPRAVCPLPRRAGTGLGLGPEGGDASRSRPGPGAGRDPALGRLPLRDRQARGRGGRPDTVHAAVRVPAERRGRLGRGGLRAVARAPAVISRTAGAPSEPARRTRTGRWTAAACVGVAVAATAAGSQPAAPPMHEPTGLVPHALAAADLNGDGKPDLVVANTGGGTLTLYHGDGTGRFGTPQEIGGIPGPASLAVGDFDGDGRP